MLWLIVGLTGEEEAYSALQTTYGLREGMVKSGIVRGEGKRI